MPTDIQSFLNDWGVSLGLLAIAGLSFLILFFLSVREFMSWFLRTSKVVQYQKEIVKSLSLIEERLTEIQSNSRPLESKVEVKIAENKTPSSAPLFPLEEKTAPQSNIKSHLDL